MIKGNIGDLRRDSVIEQYWKNCYFQGPKKVLNVMVEGLECYVERKTEGDFLEVMEMDLKDI